MSYLKKVVLHTNFSITCPDFIIAPEYSGQESCGELFYEGGRFMYARPAVGCWWRTTEEAGEPVASILARSSAYSTRRALAERETETSEISERNVPGTVLAYRTAVMRQAPLLVTHEDKKTQNNTSSYLAGIYLSTPYTSDETLGISSWYIAGR